MEIIEYSQKPRNFSLRRNTRFFSINNRRLPYNGKYSKNKTLFFSLTGIFLFSTKKDTFLKAKNYADFCYIDGAKIVFNYSLKNSEK